MAETRGTRETAVSVADFKAAAEKSGADWRSSSVQMGVLDGATGERRIKEGFHGEKWQTEYAAAFGFGEELAQKVAEHEPKADAANNVPDVEESEVETETETVDEDDEDESERAPTKAREEAADEKTEDDSPAPRIEDMPAAAELNPAPRVALKLRMAARQSSMWERKSA